MKLKQHNTEQLSTGAITLTLFSAIAGGHFTASYLLYDPDPNVMELLIKIVLGLLVLNLLYFLICLCSMLMNIPNKPVILKAVLFMLINIPIAIGYLFIVIKTIT